MNKKWVTIGVVGILALGGSYWGYEHFTIKPVVASNITVKAKMGNVSKVITATGTVNLPHAIPLTFAQAGKIVQLNVKAGDSIKAGQVLAKLDDAKLIKGVMQAQANVTSAQARLQILQDGFNAQTQDQAQAGLASAQQSVAATQQSITTAQQNADSSYLANQVVLANQTVKQASDALAKAQQSGNESSIQPAQSSLNKALTDLTTVQNDQNGGAAQALASAQAKMRSAEANLKSAQDQVEQQAQGPKSGDLQLAQSGIELAQIGLASAQTDLSNSAIIAPVDAEVVSAPLQLDQQSDAKSIITITPAGTKLQVDTTINQSDITQVKVGQKVDITLDAYPNQHISGTVDIVTIQGTIVSNVPTFTVTSTVDQASDLLRAGMNANIHIVVAEAKNVLTVPRDAVKTRGNQTGVMVPASAGKVDQAAQASTQPNNAAKTGTGNAVANSRFTTVEIGIDDGTNVEIKSGINEGQEVIIGTSSSTTAKAKATS